MLRNTKISIRVSILTIFVILLIVVGATIIGVDYYADNRIVLKSAEKLLQRSGELVQDQTIANYLHPLSDRVNLSVSLFSEGVINPQHLKRFNHYLHSLIIEHPYINSAYFGDTKGNFYEVGREKDKMFSIKNIFRSVEVPYMSDKLLDQHDRVIKTTRSTTIQYDHRNRFWYKRAEQSGERDWSDVYMFFYHPGVLGMTLSAPVYNAAGKLQGVFGLDVTMNSLIEFVSSLKISLNSVIFILSPAGNMIFSEDISRDKVINIKDVAIPWVKKSFSEYMRHKRPWFFYTYKHQKYLATYKAFSGTENETWHVAIVLPVSDIVGPFQRNVLISLLSALVVLLLGLIFVYFVTKKISSGIIRLADEATKIKNLDLTKPKRKKTRIKEIFYMRKAFDAMRSGLQSFIRYVPYTLVKHLIASKEVAHVGGKSKTLTILFSDIDGFTSLSESMQPDKLTKYLSEYFEEMTKIVHKTQGTVDKYIGDAVMAFWGAPKDDELQAFHACQCALLFLETLRKLNVQWHKKHKPKLTVRIGINTGTVVVGNVGSHDRLSYTAMGDSVNLANRLEVLNKSYKSTIIVSESTYNQVQDKFKFRSLGYVEVRGKKQGCNVYELLGENED